MRGAGGRNRERRSKAPKMTGYRSTRRTICRMREQGRGLMFGPSSLPDASSAHSFLRTHAAARNRPYSRLWLMVTAFLLGVAFLPAMSVIGGYLRPKASTRDSDGGGVETNFRRGQEEQVVDWKNAPRVDLVCRTYGGSLHIMWNSFFPSYLLFWPMRAWKSSGLVVILDGETPGDREQGTVLQHLALPSMVRVKYEAPAPEGTLCSNWRREGYSRQQYSNFYADLYTDAEFVAIVDTDSAFRAPVVPSDLFEDGKPIVVGFNQQSEWTSNVSTRAVGGHEGVGRFMSRYSFPVVLRASDMPEMRAGIARNMGAATFEEAFHMICSEGAGTYSQFEIILNYMWYNMRDSYAWHIADPTSGSFEEISGQDRPRATQDEAVLSKDVPTVLLMRHMGKAIDPDSIGPSAMFRNLCYGSDYQAGYCETQEPTGNDGVPITGKWTAAGTTWLDTYQGHLREVGGAWPAFGWRSEVPEDWVFPGSE